MISYNDANFILTGGIGGCHNDNVDAAMTTKLTLHYMQIA